MLCINDVAKIAQNDGKRKPCGNFFRACQTVSRALYATIATCLYNGERYILAVLIVLNTGV